MKIRRIQERIPIAYKGRNRISAKVAYRGLLYSGNKMAKRTQYRMKAESKKTISILLFDLKSGKMERTMIAGQNMIGDLKYHWERELFRKYLTN